MKHTVGRTGLVLALGFIILFTTCTNASKNQAEPEKDIESEEIKWTRDQEEVKATVERFLIEIGNYNEVALKEMVLEKANLAASSYGDGQWQIFTSSMNEYFENNRTRQRTPFYEPVQKWDIIINQGQIALVQADAIFHTFGVPRSRNIDNFTLLKENGKWKFLSLSYTRYPLPEEERIFTMEAFAKGYAQAWSGVRPNFVALFFEEDGILQVNDGAPAQGRNEIAKIAEDFMTDLPDMVVRFDSLVTKSEGTEFHWTLMATNLGPGGTGNKVKVSGFELWQMGENGLVQSSQGHFPSDEYNRQLKFGIDKPD